MRGLLPRRREYLAPGIEARLAERRAVTPGAVPEVAFGLLGQAAALRGALLSGQSIVLGDPGAVPVSPAAGTPAD
ncbi:hypothetical protein [Streptomyces sp. WAC08241]|uniref:hypothetical protein n=1 Tax=Streptomyces sp. WAC08241 TaxID=2487421 RepID=UPI000F781C1E|nr:hypothetical protein [Streptomyces sp. WAC08241]RSS41810.1 hypothetical protein EF906_13665 [Streptomyces sp. WAC08241]